MTYLLNINVTGLARTQMRRLEFKLDKLSDKLEKIMATQSDHAQQLRDLKAQNDRDSLEQQAAFKKLEDALAAAGGTTAEVDTAMAELKMSIETRDALTPTEPPVEPPPPEPEPTP